MQGFTGRPHEEAMKNYPTETIVEQLVMYSIEIDGHLVVIENVPARVVQETGEQLFAPETVARVMELIKNGRPDEGSADAGL